MLWEFERKTLAFTNITQGSTYPFRRPFEPLCDYFYPGFLPSAARNPTSHITEVRRKMKSVYRWQRLALLLGLAATLVLSSVSASYAEQETTPLSGMDKAFGSLSDTIALCGCDDCCDCGTGCDCGSACGCCDSRLFGLFKRSEPCFDRFISPMTNPVFFEDPRTLTEARTIFLQHKVPQAAAGGDIQLIAVQLRAALTDRLSIVASKDGFASSSNDLIDDGWADVAAGLKYNLMADPQAQRILSTGFHYEMPVGTPRTLQGNGDGEFHIYMNGGMEILDYGHWISASGFRLPSDPDAESSMWYWSNHFDYEVRQGWYLLTELNWFNWIGAGTNTVVPGVEGGDLFNLGSVGVAGNDIVTNAVGLKYKPNRHNELGVAFEYPLTERKDVLDNRLTVDWILRY